jgi:hypothetical protein
VPALVHAVLEHERGENAYVSPDAEVNEISNRLAEVQ